MAVNKQELATMGIIELLDKLIWDSGNASHYRYRIVEMMGETRTNSVAGLLDSTAGEEEETQPTAKFIPITVDYQSLIVNRQTAETLAPLCAAILGSGWDKIDLRRRMYTTPEEVTGFLTDIIDNNWSYNDLSDGQKGMISTIVHSFRYWLQRNKSTSVRSVS